MEFSAPERSELIVARLAPATAFLYLAGEVHEPPRRNVTKFFQELPGELLTGVSIARYDRLLRLSFGDHTLVLRFYDRPNAFLLRKDEVVSTFKKAGETAPAVSSDDRFDAEKSLSLLSKPLRNELAHRRIDIDSFEKELRSGTSTFIYRPNSDFVLSPIRLKHLDGAPEVYTSASESVEYVIVNRLRIQALEGNRKSLLHAIDTILDKTATARIEASGALADTTRIDRYTHIGQEILSHAADLDRGSTTLTVYVDGNDYTAQLDPALTPYENANRFFEKARSAKMRKGDVQRRIESLDRDEERLLLFRTRIVDAEHLKALEAIRKDLAQGRFTLQQAADAIGREGPRFREYEVAGGMRVLVGKNAKQNDELTLHVAQKEDLWFHARHVSGSHVVLRSGKRPNIPQRAIEQAAELAAYFSDARSQLHAPVAYTRRKYVRKPKGAAPGAVKIEREEVIVVTPQITAKQIS
jgi:predicted ribosome quality control (RQC) complex YloA/Tae2 family protein